MYSAHLQAEQGDVGFKTTGSCLLLWLPLFFLYTFGFFKVISELVGVRASRSGTPSASQRALEFKLRTFHLGVNHRTHAFLLTLRRWLLWLITL